MFDKPNIRKGSSRRVNLSSHKLPVVDYASQQSGQSNKNSAKSNKDLSAFASKAEKKLPQRPSSGSKRINIDALGFDQVSQASSSKKSSRSHARSRGASMKSQHNVVSGGSFAHLCREIE